MARDTAATDNRGRTPKRDARLDSPVFYRNGPIITEHLRTLLADARGNVLEIGSGTGQHIAAFAEALQHLTWWPSDADQRCLASIDAWRRHSGLANLRPPCRLDAAENPWMPEPDDLPLDRGLAAVISINVAHISPWEVCTGILRGAGRHLGPGGVAVFYGPFIRDDIATAPSNVAFDRDLRARNPEWGIRSLAALSECARAEGLEFAQFTEVPANNLIVEYRKPA